MTGLSTIGNISLGIALVAGRNRVPRPAAGITAVRTVIAAFLHSAKFAARARSTDRGTTERFQVGIHRFVAPTSNGSFGIGSIGREAGSAKTASGGPVTSSTRSLR